MRLTKFKGMFFKLNNHTLITLLLLYSVHIMPVIASDTDSLKLTVYTGSTPWDPQINFMYDDGQLIYDYRLEYDDEIFEKVITKKVIRILTKEENKIFINSIRRLGLFELKGIYINKEIADGLSTVVNIIIGDKRKIIRIENVEVKKISELVNIINAYSSKDVRLFKK